MINSVEIKYTNSGRFPVITINGEEISRYMSLSDYIYDDIFRWADQFYEIIDGELAESYEVVVYGHPFHKWVLDCLKNKSEYCTEVKFNAIGSKISFKDKFNYAYDFNSKHSISTAINKKFITLQCNEIEKIEALNISDVEFSEEDSEYAIAFEGNGELHSKFNIYVSDTEQVQKSKTAVALYVNKENLNLVVDYFNVYHVYLPAIEETFTKLANASLDLSTKLEFEAYNKEEYRLLIDELPATIESGECFEITYDYFPKCFEKPAIKVFVDNPSVISCDGEMLVANEKGSCDVRVCDPSGVEYAFKTIEVTKHNYATNITVVLPATSMKIGDTLKFRCIVNPNDAEDANDLTYTVSDEKVAVISSKNELYALASGRVIVTVSTPRVSRKVFIDVLSPAVGIAVSSEEIEVPCNAEATFYCAPIPINACPKPILNWGTASNNVFNIVHRDTTKCTIYTLNPGNADLYCKIDGTNIVKRIRITVPEEKGCYVATAVYGSYNCPEVWVLRRFRDNYLEKYTLGKLFIKTYYAVSPTVVKLFGKTKWFNKFWKSKLDKMVKKLQAKGYKDTPYNGG